MTERHFRLLVVRLGAMGDILHALPAVTALRQAHPDWVIDWLVEPRWRALLATEAATAQSNRSSAQPLIDHLHFAATKLWRKAPFSRQTRTEFQALCSSFRNARYDAVIDLQGAIRSALLARLAARLSGCKRIIGEAEPRERAAHWLFTERVGTQGAHVIEQDVELVSAIAPDALNPDALKPVQPWLPVDATAEAWADAILPPAATSPAVLINPGAGWGAKRWPAERYAEVARGLIAQGCRVLANAGPGEEALAQQIFEGTQGAARSLSCSLAQLIAITRRMALVVAGDTGPLHLACALRVPVVGIYGPTDPSRNGPYGTRFTVLRSPLSRRDHSRYEAPEAGLLTINSDEVLRAAGALLYPVRAPEDNR